MLSTSEQRQLKRAIYHWQIFRDVLEKWKVCEDYDYRIFSEEEKDEFSFASMAPWEAEEIATTHQYAIARYKDLIWKVAKEVAEDTTQFAAEYGRRAGFLHETSIRCRISQMQNMIYIISSP